MQIRHGSSFGKELKNQNALTHNNYIANLKQKLQSTSSTGNLESHHINTNKKTLSIDDREYGEYTSTEPIKSQSGWRIFHDTPGGIISNIETNKTMVPLKTSKKYKGYLSREKFRKKRTKYKSNILSKRLQGISKQWKSEEPSKKYIAMRRDALKDTTNIPYETEDHDQRLFEKETSKNKYLQTVRGLIKKKKKKKKEEKEKEEEEDDYITLKASPHFANELSYRNHIYQEKINAQIVVKPKRSQHLSKKYDDHYSSLKLIKRKKKKKKRYYVIQNQNYAILRSVKLNLNDDMPAIRRHLEKTHSFTVEPPPKDSVETFRAFQEQYSPGFFQQFSSSNRMDSFEYHTRVELEELHDHSTTLLLDLSYLLRQSYESTTIDELLANFENIKGYPNSCDEIYMIVFRALSTAFYPNYLDVITFKETIESYVSTYPKLASLLNHGRLSDIQFPNDEERIKRLTLSNCERFLAYTFKVPPTTIYVYDRDAAKESHAALEKIDPQIHSIFNFLFDRASEYLILSTNISILILTADGLDFVCGIPMMHDIISRIQISERNNIAVSYRNKLDIFEVSYHQKKKKLVYACITSIVGNTKGIVAFRFSKKCIVIATNDFKIRKFSSATGKLLHFGDEFKKTMIQLEEDIHHLFVHDELQIIIACLEESVILLSMDHGRIIKVLKAPEGIIDATMVKNSLVLLCSSIDSLILFDLNTYKGEYKTFGSSKKLTQLFFPHYPHNPMSSTIAAVYSNHILIEPIFVTRDDQLFQPIEPPSPLLSHSSTLFSKPVLEKEESTAPTSPHALLMKHRPAPLLIPQDTPKESMVRLEISSPHRYSIVSRERKQRQRRRKKKTTICHNMAKNWSQRQQRWTYLSDLVDEPDPTFSKQIKENTLPLILRNYKS